MSDSKQSFKDILNNTEVPVLVDFYADWCGPCKMMTPVIKQLASKYKGQVRVLKVDVDKNPKVSFDYQIRGVPTFMIFKNGELQWRQAGAMPGSVLESELEKAMQTPVT